ncbi:MAG: DUF1893 domain-containing protein [Candidatus Bathyarchaeia archaeon]
MRSLEYLLARLEEEGLSLLILKNGKIVYKSRDGGIAPLLEAIDVVGLGSLSGSIVVDKVVGKAAALLIAYFQAKEVFAKIMSWMGAGILKREGIKFVAKEFVENIRNRDGTGLCPFEALVSEVEDSQEAYRLLRFKRSGGDKI